VVAFTQRALSLEKDLEKLTTKLLETISSDKVRCVVNSVTDEARGEEAALTNSLRFVEMEKNKRL